MNSHHHSSLVKSNKGWTGEFEFSLSTPCVEPYYKKQCKFFQNQKNSISGIKPPTFWQYMPFANGPIWALVPANETKMVNNVSWRSVMEGDMRGGERGRWKRFVGLGAGVCILTRLISRTDLMYSSCEQSSRRFVTMIGVELQSLH